MSAELCPRSVAMTRRRGLPRQAALAGLIAILLFAQGCAAVPPRVSQGADPADRNVRVAATHYRPVLGGYAGGRPAEPAPWTGRNDGVAPAAKDGR